VDQRVENEGATGATKTLHIRLAPHAGIEVKAVTGMVVNFTGQEFVVTMFQGVAPAFRGPDELPDEIEGRVLFRALISPQRWAEVIDSGAAQLAQFRELGMMPPKSQSEEDG